VNKILLQFIESSHNMSVHYYYVPTISMAEIKDPFADWIGPLNKSVYSIDGKKIGFLRKVVVADYLCSTSICRISFISIDHDAKWYCTI
jgi:hypothetical protein